MKCGFCGKPVEVAYKLFKVEEFVYCSKDCRDADEKNWVDIGGGDKIYLKRAEGKP